MQPPGTDSAKGQSPALTAPRGHATTPGARLRLRGAGRYARSRALADSQIPERRYPCQERRPSSARYPRDRPGRPPGRRRPGRGGSGPGD